ncbi:hypothetical protein [Alloscardovia omnicolens]|uniref:hypothetical protein n=1 Tax=Alloscardovia omnicolens TaxID=419015 RepID=UPI003A71816C
MTTSIERVLRLSENKRKDNTTTYSAELVLEMIESCLRQGASLPTALHMVGYALHNIYGDAFMSIAEAMKSGEDWDHVWKPYLVEGSGLFAIVHDVLEPAYKRGVSPALRIENAIEQLKDNDNLALSYASHELAVGILLPLGLCFLPGFVLLTVIPLLSSWFGLSA